MQLLHMVNRIAHGANLWTVVFLHDHSFSLKLLLIFSFVQVKDGLCCDHLITDLLVERAKRSARNTTTSRCGSYSCLLFLFVCFEGVANVEQNAGLCGMRVHEFET